MAKPSTRIATPEPTPKPGGAVDPGTVTVDDVAAALNQSNADFEAFVDSIPIDQYGALVDSLPDDLLQRYIAKANNFSRNGNGGGFTGGVTEHVSVWGAASRAFDWQTAAETVAGIIAEPVDWILTAREIYKAPGSIYSYAGLLPIVPASAGKAAKKAVKKFFKRFKFSGTVVAAQKGGALVPKGAKPLGDWGETRLKNLLGGKGSKTNFSTSTGRREVDRLVDRVAHESKAGINVKPTSSIRRQIAKDKELIDSGQIDGAHWHFWQGADHSLLDELTQNGIDYTVH